MKDLPKVTAKKGLARRSEIYPMIEAISENQQFLSGEDINTFKTAGGVQIDFTGRYSDALIITKDGADPTPCREIDIVGATVTDEGNGIVSVTLPEGADVVSLPDGRVTVSHPVQVTRVSKYKIRLKFA